MGATTGQYLQFNGTTWTPITLQAGTGLTLPYSDNTGTGGAAFKVSNTQTAGASWSYGLMGEAQSTSGSMGVYGSATATSGPGYGVQGETKSSEGRGFLVWRLPVRATLLVYEAMLHQPVVRGCLAGLWLPLVLPMAFGARVSLLQGLAFMDGQKRTQAEHMAFTARQTQSVAGPYMATQRQVRELPTAYVV